MTLAEIKKVAVVMAAEAVERGIDRVRLPHWTNLDDHLKVDIGADGEAGPWVHLYSPTNEVIGQKNPQDILLALADDGRSDWREYHGAAQ